ncbi:cytochrome c3 family protein [Geomonas sp. RF6]|uniref:cytochrome c3 family protein n=1 Tax=Geomonas sp. RF6 TaxID=2897342 RepID=UPI001E5EC8D0|nr:cytochrome c3 family protein [Geomonas sp. RF6]UFS71059.1 cytochrome c3 family protein [Geomonas sp. RF6]
MLRKVGLMCALVLTLPAFANAWTLTAKVASGLGAVAGGASTIVTRTADAKSAVIGYRQVAAGENVLVTVTPDASPAKPYAISSIVVDGAMRTKVVNGVTVADTTPTFPVLADGKNHAVVAYFTPVTYSLYFFGTDAGTAAAPKGGAVYVQRLGAGDKLVGGIISARTDGKVALSGLAAGTKVRVYAAPNADYTVTSILDKAPLESTGANISGTGVRYYRDMIISTNNTENVVKASFALVPNITLSFAASNLNGVENQEKPILLTLDSTTNDGFVTYTLSDPSLVQTRPYPIAAPNKVEVNYTPTTAGIKTIKVVATTTHGGKAEKTLTFNILSDTANKNSICSSCHSNRNPGSVLADSVDRTCSSCHDPNNTGHQEWPALGAASAKFASSRHWNNHYEYGPEFRDPVTGIDGILNANESYTTEELKKGVWGVVTCSVRCHFKNITQSGVYGCKACHSDGLKTDGSFKNASSSHGLAKTYNDTCTYCHSGSKHGKVPAEFFASKHWNSSLEVGPEFTAQMNVTVSGPTVTNLGTQTDGYLNANDSYKTKENGVVKTCAYRCHFRPGMAPADVTPPAQYVKDGRALTYVAYSSPYGAGKYSRYGGNACMACHDPHGLAANARTTCYTCHAGGNHGWSVAAFEKSTHFTGKYAILDGIGGPTGEACTGCHNPHSTEAVFAAYSADSAVVKRTVGCQKCHTPGGKFSVYSSTGVLARTHGGGAKTSATSGGANDNAKNLLPTARPQYMAQGMNCVDCHGHNNTMNADYAESGHGHVSADPMNAFTHYDWKARENDFKPGVYGTRHNSNCNRCHTTYGFLTFANQTTGLTRLQLKLGETNAVMACITCHKTAEGALRTDMIIPDGNVTLKNGYVARFVQAGQTDKTVTFPAFKNSNICVPCHSGRTTGSVVKDYYALGNYTSGQTNFYQHAANIGQTFIGTGAYEFAAANYINLPKHHTGAGMSLNTEKGPCATCHNAHSLKAEVTEASCMTQYCHDSGFSNENVERAKTNYNAAVKVLTGLVQKKLFPLFVNASGTDTIYTERAAVRWGRFGKAPGEAADAETASKANGAWYNWHILTNADPAAWAHNPAYARAILLDTIDFLDDGVNNDSARATVATSAATSSQEKQDGKLFAATQGCNGCHYEALVSKHFANVSSAIKASYITSRSECVDCHTKTQYHYATPAANAAYAESGHGELTAAPWNGRNWAQQSECVVCHTATGYKKFVASNFTDAKAWAATTEGPNEVLSCVACHTDAAGARVAVPQVTAFYNVSTVDKGTKLTVKSKIAAQFPNVGDSNLCITCHAGRVNGDNLAAISADANVTASNFGFQNSHYMAASGIMYMKAGFINFTTLTAPAPSNLEGAAFASTKTYGKTLLPDNASTPGGIAGGQKSAHRIIGTTLLAPAEADDNLWIENTDYLSQQGPCVNCHIQAYKPHKGNASAEFNKDHVDLYAGDVPANRTGAGHKLTALDDETIKQICLPCHAHTQGLNMENFMAVKVEPARVPYQDTLELIKTILWNYGISYNSAAHPYFYDLTKDPAGKTAVTDWTRGGQLTKQQAMRLMGACFNLNVLARDPGAYVHGRTYSQRLQYDTIDFLDDLKMNFSALDTARKVWPQKFYGNNANTGYTGTEFPVASEGILWLSGTHPNNNEIAPPNTTDVIRVKVRP